ncbi:hypothetical protein D5R81_03610 [Parashewanella spongiae]|uniref:Uncharacterized protein n=1 Tax=Parashewanella spongiae TaxID=342950 RepID=A0A3A6U096_9GAMM|nr:hypothetical protein [Parashewanella spongiae]MCL1077126.1 hypothetical protein [Parashewanella spongiae]RJY18851.1 hypothetical protein D5R81_03610 [Parashewanella spongiae]
MSFVLSNRVVIVFLCAFLATIPHAKGQDLRAKSLRLNSATDDQGQPLKIPKDDNNSHFEGAVSVVDNNSQNEQTKPRFFKDLSRKEMLHSRASIANDPSCRWLHNRLQFLEHKLKMGMDMRFGFHKKEWKARHKEWVCLKCGVEGPSIHDYAQCQFKR